MGVGKLFRMGGLVCPLALSLGSQSSHPTRGYLNMLSPTRKSIINRIPLFKLSLVTKQVFYHSQAWLVKNHIIVDRNQDLHLPPK